jgi:hypothetical protein
MEVSEILRDATCQTFNLNEGSREGHLVLTAVFIVHHPVGS